MPGDFRQLLSLLDASEKRQAVYLLILIVITAFLELASVSLIMPFMSLLTKPDIAQQPAALQHIYNVLGFGDYNSFLVFAGIGIILVIVFSNFVRAICTWMTYDFTYMREYSISKKLFSIYLRQPYPFFIERNSSDLSKNILNEVGVLVGGIIITGMLMISRLFVIAFIGGFLLWINPLATVLIAIFFGLFYAAIYFGFNKKIEAMGKERLVLAERRFNVIREAFLNVKETRIYGSGDQFLNRYADASALSARYSARQEIIGRLPAFLMEAVGLSAALGVILYNIAFREGDFVGLIPVLSVYIFAGYRLLPNVQQVFANLARIHFTRPVLSTLYREFVLSRSMISPAVVDKNVLPDTETVLSLRDVTFGYDQSIAPSLAGVSFEAAKGQIVGIVGRTGAGKTTLIDLALGLLSPDSGEIKLHGKSISETGDEAWHSRFAYVSQTVSLFDATVAENIAVNAAPGRIDRDRLAKVLSLAELTDTIKGLPQGVDTPVGENGVRLSGGQKQRLSLARALYHDAEILILDEATSALDSVTERTILERLCKEASKTILMVTHRPAALEYCDNIIVLERGEVKAQGKYGSLATNNDLFRELIRNYKAESEE